MSDPRGIIGVPEVSASVQASARIERLSERRRDQQQEQSQKKKSRQPKPLLPPVEDDGEPHVDLLA